MTTTKNEAHAISNARGQLETIKELYREFKKQEDLEAWDCGSNVYNWTSEGIREQAQNALRAANALIESWEFKEYHPNMKIVSMGWDHDHYYFVVV